MNAWHEMILAAVRFAVWAADEGLAPTDGSPQAPEDFLYIFSRRTGHEDWDELPETVRMFLERPGISWAETRKIQDV